MSIENHVAMMLRGRNRGAVRKSRPSDTSSTTNPTLSDTGSNPGLRDERPATNRLSHGTPRAGHLRPGFEDSSWTAYRK
jgi:hypothetical protein